MFTKVIAATVLIIINVGVLGAQQKTAMSLDQTLRSNGRVNPSTLGMELSIPLGAYPGRGGLSVPISLQYSSKLWRMEYLKIDAPVTNGICHDHYTPRYSELSASGWTTDTSRPYIEYTGWDNAFDDHGSPAVTTIEEGGCGSNEFNGASVIRRITVHLPGGGTHELRPDDTVVGYSSPNSPSNISKDGTYYSTDGSNLVYTEGPGTYRLRLTDGSYLDFLPNLSSMGNPGQFRTIRYAATYKDKTGSNTITYNAANSTYPNGSVTDTLGRVIGVSLGAAAPATPTTNASPQLYSIPGFDNTNLTYKLHWKKLKDTTEAESGLTNFGDVLCYMSKGNRNTGASQPPAGSCLLFDDVPGNEYPTPFVVTAPSVGEFNPVVLTKIELPDGRAYTFGYDKYGLMNHIEYPTGGYEDVTYSVVNSLAWETPAVVGQANFGVTQRQMFESVGAVPMTWTYGMTNDANAPNGLIIRTIVPDGTKNDRYIRRGEDRTTCSPESCSGGYGFDTTLAGMAYEERTYTAADQLLSRSITTWAETSLAITNNNGSGLATGDWHPRVTKVETIVYDPATGGYLSSATTTGYVGTLSQITDAVNPNVVTQYGFSTVIGTLGALERSVETTYRTDAAFVERNMRSLPDVVVTKDAGGVVRAKSQVFYDDAGYGVSAVYGLATRTRSWHDIANDLFIETKAKYDMYGNVVESTDGRGNVTQTEYSSAYGYAYPTKVTTPVPDSSGVSGSSTALTTLMAYDLTTGLPTSTTDANGQTTTISYADPITSILDPLLRVRKVTEANGHQTIAEYGAGTNSSTRWVKTRSQIDSDSWSEVINWYDGLSRAYLSEEIDQQGNIFTETEYDTFGRIKRSSNPYRSGEVKKWTTPTYDTSGRIGSVAGPDNSVSAVGYGLSTTAPFGASKVVTDQSGKKRKGIMNAFGQMVRVIEDPDGSAFVTDYVFDSLGNLRRTTQGEQNRYFMHDALGRLLFEKQPEQDTNNALTATDPVTGNTAWSAKYTYDDNSNVLSVTDARNISVTALYDKLDRIIARDYSDTTPDTSFFYDGKYLDVTGASQTATGSAKGKLTGVSSTVSRTNYIGFDNMGRLLSHQQITNGRTYETAYVYNLSSALVEETYPSGRVVKSVLDNEGRLSLVQSKKNAAFGYFTYAKNFSFDSSGAIKKMQLGNGRWETSAYNDRQQITQIGLGATDSVQDLLKLEFGYNTAGQSNNNGSIVEQKISVPAVGLNLAFTATQTYAYDGLNRINSAEEKVGGSTAWKQTFDIDRYGNRKYDTSGTSTTTLGGCAVAVCNPNISTANNRFASGQGYGYDENGNLTQDAAGQRFVYDSENRQKAFFGAANGGSNPDWTYEYDGEGRRVKKISATETTIFVYNGGGLLVAEYSTALAATQQVSYLTTDHLGTPRIITNENGDVTSRKDSMPFGGEAVSSQRVGGLNGNGYGTSGIRQGYTGYEKDSESGLEFAQARLYNAMHGRFTSVDPMNASASTADPQTFNRYAYVSNDPLNFVDPGGMSECSAEYSYDDCGGDKGFWGGGQFGDQTANDDRFFGGMPSGTANALDSHLQRISNSQAGYGFITNAESTQKLAATFWIWYDSYDTNDPQSANPHFNSLDANFHYSELSRLSNSMNDRGRALMKDLGRRGPALQKITNTMGALSLGIIAAPYIADASISALARLSIDYAMEAAVGRASVNPRIYLQLEKQFGQSGSRSIFRALRGAEKALEEHVTKVRYLRYKSQVEGTIRNTASQIRTIMQFISDKYL